MSNCIAIEGIESYKKDLCKIAIDIWNNPEPPYREYNSSKLVGELLKKAGFNVEIGVFGVPTAIRASWGHGKPVIGYLGEYDALPSMSQKLKPIQEPVIEGGYGHACGHNLIATGHAAAAIGLKMQLEKENLQGTVVYYGCPAEELGTGKALMARGGAFRDLDIALAYHPSWFTYAFLGGKSGSLGIKFHFYGKSSHAGSSPFNGRNALNAVELTNVGANYLREYLNTGCKLYYTISDVGSKKPGIIPDYACAYYSYKGPTIEAIEDTRERLINVAKGAALMTGTTVKTELLGGCSALINNSVLVKVLDESLREAPQEIYTKEEIELAHSLNLTNKQIWKIKANEAGIPNKDLQYGVLPIRNFDTNGSTDVGDVSQIVPTAFCKVACYNISTNSHTWQATVCTGSSIGLKGMIYAGKALALAGVKLVKNPDLVVSARNEFDYMMDGKKYENPLPSNYSIPQE